MFMHNPDLYLTLVLTIKVFFETWQVLAYLFLHFYRYFGCFVKFLCSRLYTNTLKDMHRQKKPDLMLDICCVIEGKYHRTDRVIFDGSCDKDFYLLVWQQFINSFNFTIDFVVIRVHRLEVYRIDYGISAVCYMEKDFDNIGRKIFCDDTNFEPVWLIQQLLISEASSLEPDFELFLKQLKIRIAFNTLTLVVLERFRFGSSWYIWFLECFAIAFVLESN